MKPRNLKLLFLPAYAIFRVFEDDAASSQVVADFIGAREVATVPSLLTFPLIGITALSATRVVEAWRRRADE